MGSVSTIVTKVLVMLIMIAVGYFISKKGILTDRGASEINTLLLKLVTPCLIVNSFLGAGSELGGLEMLYALGIDIAAIVIAIAVSFTAFHKEPPERRKVLRFAAIFSNAGFMGLPLVQGIVGDKGVVYASFFIVAFNIVCWTYGYRMMSGVTKLDFRVLLLNPGMIGLMIGLPLYFLKLDLPAVIGEPVAFFANTNTPLAMIVIGSYIAKVDFRSFVTDFSIYKMSFLRLIAAPLLYLGFLMLLHPADPDLFVSSVIQASAPVAANCVIFSVQYKCDAALASKAVAVSTVLSIISIPILTILAQLACQYLY